MKAVLGDLNKQKKQELKNNRNSQGLIRASEDSTSWLHENFDYQVL